MRKIIFITSLEHSGSTILELTLSKHFKIIGAGEIFRTLSPSRDIDKVMEKRCNCGKKARDCELWGSVLKTIQQKRINRPWPRQS